MSEYWVSKKKYFCKYCDIYIADDAPSRQQHENGMRHKGNTERFIRGLYKGSEKRKKDAEEEKRDMARVEQAAQAAFAQDVASGLAKPTRAPVASVSTAPRKPAPKPSNPFTDYSTAASLGYQDPDAERYSAEAERRRTQGGVGDWEMIATSVTSPTAANTDASRGEGVDVGFKRPAETSVDDEDTRQFKLRKKTVTLGEIYDPGLILIKVKKKEEPVEPSPTIPTTTPPQGTPTATNTPKWTTVRWTRPGETLQEEHAVQTPPSLEPPVKTEGLIENNEHDVHPSAIMEPLIETPTMKTEDSPPVSANTTSSSGSIFRKRKATAGGSRGRRAL